MINNNDKVQDITNCIKNFTDITPEVYTRDNSDDVMVIFRDKVPTEEETLQLKNALKDFGTVIQDSCLEVSFISFLILS